MKIQKRMKALHYVAQKDCTSAALSHTATQLLSSPKKAESRQFSLLPPIPIAFAKAS
jgi:hypothetical protein